MLKRNERVRKIKCERSKRERNERQTDRHTDDRREEGEDRRVVHREWDDAWTVDRVKCRGR